MMPSVSWGEAHTVKYRLLNFSRRFQTVDKPIIIFGPQAENKFKSGFPGGVYVGKNTLRGESVFLYAAGVQKYAVRSESSSSAKSF